MYMFVAKSPLKNISLQRWELINWGILGSGERVHYLMDGVIWHNKKPAETPIKITLPNGGKVTSSQTY